MEKVTVEFRDGITIPHEAHAYQVGATSIQIMIENGDKYIYPMSDIVMVKVEIDEIQKQALAESLKGGETAQ